MIRQQSRTPLFASIIIPGASSDDNIQ